jgi:hypothetical protein
MSVPAEKESPEPRTTSTVASSFPAKRFRAATISSRIGALIAFFFSGRSRRSVATPASTP